MKNQINKIKEFIETLELLITFLKVLLVENQPKESYTIVWALSAGHGGINPDGKYMTNGKFFVHLKGIFHRAKTFFEGVFNRDILYLLVKRMEEENMRFKIVSHKYLDTPLEERTRQVNELHKTHKETFYIDLHSNAFNGKARGFSVFTSPGQSESDKAAEKLINLFEEKLLKKWNLSLRVDLSDGDKDWEARFWSLMQTTCFAILPECLFFDNYEDALILNNPEFQKDYVEIIIEMMKWAEENINFDN